MTVTYPTIEPMRETSKREIKSALYGLARLVAGYQEWQVVQDLSEDDRIKALLKKCVNDVAVASSDPDNADPARLSQLNRKLRAYQQLCLVEKFCFDEVEWDD